MKLFAPVSEHVKLLGRTFLHEEKLWLSLSASGIEFQFAGKKLTIKIEGAEASRLVHNSFGYARFAIYVNDTRVTDCNLDSPLKEFTVIDSEKTTNATVRIIKLSECAFSTMAVLPLEADDSATICPTPAKNRRIEIIGDSITCGYGVDMENVNFPFICGTEDVTKSYSYRTICELDADYSIFSTSGHGIISGYTADPAVRMTDQLIPERYESYGLSLDTFGNGKLPDTIPWDFSKFVPDAVVVNLGTNDDSYCLDTLERQQEYRDRYVDFLKMIRKNNEKATIFCILGLMGDRLFPFICDAVKIYSKETGDENIHTLHIPPQLLEDGYVSDYHPTAVSHKKATAVLAPFIKIMMGWE